MNKLIIKAVFLALNVFVLSIHARQFEVFVKSDGLRTLQNKPVDIYKMIDIKGQYPDAVHIPTYGQIRKAIAESFDLDPYWKNFTIKYFTKSNNKFYFLKPHIEKLSRKERAVFLDKITQEGDNNMPMLIVAKREMKTDMNGKVSSTMEEKQPSNIVDADEIGEMSIMPVSMEEDIMIQSKPRYVSPLSKPKGDQEEEMVVPEWFFDETLVGESDPELLEKVRDANLMYGQ